MKIHGLRPELQPEAVNKKARESAEANAQADRPVRGHDDVVPSVEKSEAPARLFDVKG